MPISHASCLFQHEWTKSFVNWLREMTLAKFSFLAAALTSLLHPLVTHANEGILLDPRVNGSPPTLSISTPSFTSKWFEGTDHVQVLEMIITNTGTTSNGSWLKMADTLRITVNSASLTTVSPGTLQRLAPGDSAVVQIGVTNANGVTPGSTCSGTVVANWGSGYGEPTTKSVAASGKCGFGNYTSDMTSINFHWNPDWFNEVKFGIFFHWGIYSAPAYGSVAPNEDYAEWYWYRMHDPTFRTKTYQYHNLTYGPNFNYDDFIANFTASQFDAKSWIQLVADAGAQYVVPVAKHHDGFALFNFSTSISQRSSVHLGPHRDFIGELLSAAKKFHPQIRRGTYFSMPEWYNPAYARYATTQGGGFPGGPPKNPYTNETVPYTGYVNVSDFVSDIQLPQMNTLAYDYETEIMWCDIGGANNATIFVSEWLNWASMQGRQVAFNNRCGIQGDFDTPEYTTNGGSVSRKWESNRGMDPFSYGYNYQTPESAYLKPGEIVQSLVDIVSKNGNFLLDIGPKNDGSIPTIMQTNLRAAGLWIKAHSESIFKTRYWLRTPGTGNLRYSTTPTAFYIHTLVPPADNVLVPDPVPFLEGDSVTILGGKSDGVAVGFTANPNGSFTLVGSEEVAGADEYVWTFKITYMS